MGSENKKTSTILLAKKLATANIANTISLYHVAGRVAIIDPADQRIHYDMKHVLGGGFSTYVHTVHAKGFSPVCIRT